MENTIRLAGVVRESIVDGPGIRFTIFCQGCAHACYNCQNKETWDFNAGYDCEIEKILKAIDEDPLLDGVTFSGGDPIYQAEAFYSLALEIKKRNLNIVLFTGFTFEELLELGKENKYIIELLKLTDILIDGRYEDSERDLTLLFRGSKNQRVLNANKSLEKGAPVLDDRYN